MRLSLRTKTILGTAIIEGALLLLLVFTATRFMTDTVNESMIKRASTAAKLFSTTTKDAVLSYDLASLESFVGEALTNPDIAYARVVSNEGLVFAEKGDQAALQRLFVADVDLSSVQDGVFDTFADINEAGVNYGRVELGLSISSSQQAIATITRWTATIATIEILLVALFSYFLGNYLTGSLESLSRATRKIKQSVELGSFKNTRLDKRGHDEIATLIESFNGLIDTLETESERKRSFELALKELNASLENKVAERTQELANKSNQLQRMHTEFKLAQQKLMHSEKMASVGQLAAGIAHEINNPIGFVNSNIAVMHDYTKIYISLSRKLKEYLQAVEANDLEQIEQKRQILADFYSANDLSYVSKDMFELINDTKEGLQRVSEIVQSMKSFSRADANEKQEFDVNKCIETTVKMVRAQVEKRAQLSLNLGDVPHILINVGKINQILTNLMVNASQAIENKGRVAVNTMVKGDYVAIQVLDNGKGMDEETMKHIFNPFYTTKPEGEGTGLGLSISYEIAQEHGGSLSVQSKLGQGSCFTLLLPINYNSKENVA